MTVPRFGFQMANLLSIMTIIATKSCTAMLALCQLVPDAPKTKSFYVSSSYKQYVSVNQRFADTIVANYQEGDISMFVHLLFLLRIDVFVSLG